MSLTKEEKRVVDKAYRNKDNLTHEEYRIFGSVSDRLNLDYDLSLVVASKRILEITEGMKE